MKIVYSGCINCLNLGDDILPLIYMNKIKELFINDYKIETYVEYNSELKKYNFDDILNNFELYVVGGGSIIHSGEISYTKHCINNNFNYVFLCGTGVGNCDGFIINKNTLQNICNGELDFNRDVFNDDNNILDANVKYLNNCNKICGGFRSENDIEILKKFGLQYKKKIYDIGLLVKNIINNTKNIKIKNGEKKIISLNLANITSLNSFYNYDNTVINYLELENKIFHFILYLINQNYYICFIPFGKNELHLHKSMYNKIINTLHIDEDNNNYMYCLDDFNYNEILNIIKNSYCVIGTRLHSNVFAASFNVPFIMLAYEYKCINFAKSIDMLEYVILTYSNDINIDIFIEKIMSINTNYLNIKLKLKKHVEYAEILYNEELKKIFDNYHEKNKYSKKATINYYYDMNNSAQYMPIIILFDEDNNYSY